MPPATKSKKAKKSKAKAKAKRGANHDGAKAGRARYPDGKVCNGQSGVHEPGELLPADKFKAWKRPDRGYWDLAAYCMECDRLRKREDKRKRESEKKAKDNALAPEVPEAADLSDASIASALEASGVTPQSIAHEYLSRMKAFFEAFCTKGISADLMLKLSKEIGVLSKEIRECFRAQRALEEARRPVEVAADADDVDVSEWSVQQMVDFICETQTFLDQIKPSLPKGALDAARRERTEATDAAGPAATAVESAS